MGINKVSENCMVKHIAFIMDGNGRWAKSKGFPREYGHKYGAEVFRKIMKVFLHNLSFTEYFKTL